MTRLLSSASLALLASGWLPPTSAIGPVRRDRGPLFTTSTVVRTLDIDTFDVMMNDTKTVWIVDFYSPWCPHCRQFAPQWEQVGTVYADIDAIQLGAVDCTRQNEICDREGVHSYPGVKMYHVPPESTEAIDMPHARHVYARHVAKWIEEMLMENNMQAGIDVDKVYPKNTLRSDLKKKEFKFGDPVEPLHDELSVDIQQKRLKDAGTTALFTFEDGFFMGTTVLEGDRYEAAVTWVKTLAGSFPMKENRAAFAVLLGEMKRQERWKLPEWKEMLLKWQNTSNGMSYPVNLFASKDDLAFEIMSAIRLVVTHFFGCEECKRHFLKANPESVVRKLALRDDDGPQSVAFWIWTMHNIVNKPLSLNPELLNEEDIFAYIRGVYKIEGNLKLGQHTTTSATWFPMVNFTSMATVALLIAVFAMVFQQHKHRLVGMKALKARDHIA
ncbi:Thioredoxin-like protein [Phytophthora palmivora]|uniref:Sulfhydryl oxidase n=1 Tax=Phytophthora palmivora TaxID=4796 RepID=A0A2P4X158_9STRA|nr:Thioredoxin-like protein [Phytophthora palmivora]